jgi:hypothetical protein
MTARCCTSGGPKRPLASTVASILPGAAVLLLPKCPLCLAAWLTITTGIGVSATAVAWARELVMVVWIALLALAVAQAVSLRTRFRPARGADSPPHRSCR